MHRVAILVVVLWSSVVSAADPQLPVLIISDGGYAWMIQGADGKPVLYQFSHVIVIGKPSTPVPPVVTPPSSFGFEAQAREWLKLVPVPAQGNVKEISKAIADTIALIKAGKLKTIPEMEGTLGLLLVVAIQDKAAWAPFGAKLEAALTANSAKIKTGDDFIQVLTEVSKGIQP